VGSSYIAIECACFLKALQCSVTVMIRNKALRGFDENMAKILMKQLDLTIIKKSIITKVELLNNNVKRVHYKKNNKIKHIDVNTILLAIGRSPNIYNMNLKEIGIKIENKIIVNENNQTNVDNIYAIGDVCNNHELNTIAVFEGKYLIKRLYGNENIYLNYNFIPSAIFSLPVEYAFIGLTEENAKKNGEIEVYHSYDTELEWELIGEPNKCYFKIICNNIEEIVGIHIISLNASEIIQGFCLAVVNKMNINDINKLIGIHPTMSENIINLQITKSSGISPKKQSC
jgi:thioredoxin reductase (NADPH)